MKDGSTIHLLRVSSQQLVGGLQSDRDLVLQRSRITVEHASAKKLSAMNVGGDVFATAGSLLRVLVAFASEASAGISAAGNVQISNGSMVEIEGAHGRMPALFTFSDLIVEGHSAIQISHVSASSYGAGVVARERLRIIGSSTVSVSHAWSGGVGAGIIAGDILLAEGSLLYLHNMSAEGSGGGLRVIPDSKGSVEVTTSSAIKISQARSGGQGGGFLAESLTVTNLSIVDVADATSEQQGGGFSATTLDAFEVSSWKVSLLLTVMASKTASTVSMAP